ncbi:hypothetical protein WJX74_010303 [Apatococcus lobatus]|uniref:Uncharacterized protein n=1 Tax=Apatococcus lobatus TaxID=904363 RepID=A0AAW1SC01_9CHLO
MLFSGPAPRLSSGTWTLLTPSKRRELDCRRSAPVSASDAQQSSWDKAYQYQIDLRLVSLRGSVPSAWIDDFRGVMEGKGRISMSQRGQLFDIFKELSDPKKKNSAATADAVTLGDAWLGPAIARGLLQPIPEAKVARWWSSLYPHWRKLIQRDSLGHAAAEGQVWAAPYRWGATLIAFRKDLLLRNGGRPVQDWTDLLQPKLRGRLGFVDAPREFLGAAMRSLGLSMNEDISSGSCEATFADVQARVQQLHGQVRVFSNNEHVRALSGGDVWAIVGWSGDLLPLAARTPAVQVVCPASGTALWADLWAVPSQACHGSQGRGPSPLLPAWLEHGLQPQRAQRSKGLDHGASPLLLPGSAAPPPPGQACHSVAEGAALEAAEYGMADKHMPAEAVLERSEFLLPVSSRMMQTHSRLLAL